MLLIFPWKYLDTEAQWMHPLVQSMNPLPHTPILYPLRLQRWTAFGIGAHQLAGHLPRAPGRQVGKVPHGGAVLGGAPPPTKKDRPVEAQGRGDQAKEEDPSWPGSGGTRVSPEFRKMAPEKLTQSRPCARKHKGNGGGCGWHPGIWRGGVCVVPAGLTALREQVSHAAKSTTWHFLRPTPQNSHFVGHPKRREDLLKQTAWGFPPTWGQVSRTVALGLGQPCSWSKHTITSTCVRASSGVSTGRRRSNGYNTPGRIAFPATLSPPASPHLVSQPVLLRGHACPCRASPPHPSRLHERPRASEMGTRPSAQWAQGAVEDLQDPLSQIFPWAWNEKSKEETKQGSVHFRSVDIEESWHWRRAVLITEGSTVVGLPLPFTCDYWPMWQTYKTVLNLCSGRRVFLCRGCKCWGLEPSWQLCTPSEVLLLHR